MERPGPGAVLASGADQSPWSGPSTAGGGGRMTETIPAKSKRPHEVRLAPASVVPSAVNSLA